MNLLFLEYFLLPQRTLLFRILPGQERPELITLSVGRADVAKLVEDVRADVLSFRPSFESGRRAMETLVDPALVDVPSAVDLLVIVPHGPLHHLPFAALWCGDQYLGQRFAIVHLPSLQALHYIRERRRQSASPCLAVGAAPDDPLFLQRGFEREAERIAAAFGVDAVLGGDAHRERLLPTVADADVLHFATHGRFVPGNPMRSGMELPVAPGSRALAEGGRETALTAQDFLKCGLNARLVVLSACETGVNAIHPGDELEGLAHAVLSAGAASVLVSLWPVDSMATAELMRTFYDEWLGGESKVTALQRACTQLRGRSLAEINVGAERELRDASDAERLRIHVEMGDLYSRMRIPHIAEQHYLAGLDRARELDSPVDVSLLKERLGRVLQTMSREHDGQQLIDEAATPQLKRYRQRREQRTPKRLAEDGDRMSVSGSVATQSTDASRETDAEVLHPWESPFFWAPFVLIGDWQ
jgi:CHAT domain-containing protein